MLTCCHADQSGCDRGGRRPRTKYAIGTTPAELTTATTVAHIHFRPRIWLAGRRLMSMSAATLRMPSATAAVMSSLRVRLLRSLHCLLAAMTSSAYTAGSCRPAPYIGCAVPTAWPSSRLASDEPGTVSIPAKRVLMWLGPLSVREGKWVARRWVLRESRQQVGVGAARRSRGSGSYLDRLVMVLERRWATTTSSPGIGDESFAVEGR
jgi:hypothetical protein